MPSNERAARWPYCTGTCGYYGQLHQHRKKRWQYRIDSISLNGISLTIFNVSKNSFAVAIVPYTFEHTNIHQLQAGNAVNIEFDMIGKYVNRISNLVKNV